MTKKHFEAIATILNFTRSRGSGDAAEIASDIAHDLADLFAKDNPRFDRDRFLTACGIE